MVELDELARGLTEADARARRLSNWLNGRGSDPDAFGGDGPGRLGEVGRALDGQHRDAISARRSEMARIAAMADDMASAVEQAAAAYRDLEDRRAGAR